MVSGTCLMPASLASFVKSSAGFSPFLGMMTTKLLSLSFSPIFLSICLTKLAKGSEVLRAKTQTTGAEPYAHR
jgi:hypothetical protein